MTRVPSPGPQRKRPPVRRPGSKEHSLLGGAATATNTATTTTLPGAGAAATSVATAAKPQRSSNSVGSVRPKTFGGGRPTTWQASASSPEDDGGTGGAGTAPARSRVVRGGSRSRDLGRRVPSPKAINQEAGDWLEENASRLAIQTQKCLLIHRQLQDLLSRGSPRNGASADEVSWQSKTLSLQALEGAPLDLLEISEVATSERRDKLRADLTLAEEDVNRLKEEIRVEQAAGEQFQEALEAGTKVELRRLKEEVSVLEVRIQDRLDTLRQLAIQAVSPRWSPSAASPSSPSRVFVHSPVTRISNFGPKARSTSPPRQRATVPLTTFPTFTAPQSGACGACRAVSVPMIAPKQAPSLIRVAAAATAMTGRQAGATAYPLQQLDDVRHRVQAEFWSGTM